MTDTFTPLTVTELTEELATTLIVASPTWDLCRRYGLDTETETIRLVDRLQDGIHDHFLCDTDLPTLVSLIQGELRAQADRYITEAVEDFLGKYATTDRKTCETYLALQGWDTETLQGGDTIAERQRYAIAARVREILFDFVDEMAVDATGYRTDLAADLAHYGYTL